MAELHIPPALQELMGELWSNIQQAGMEREESAARTDPLGHKNSRVFPVGVSTRYVWWPLKPTKTREVRYCYSINRNVAGFFLAWREIVTKDQVKRDRWSSRRSKKAIRALTYRRYKSHKERIT